MQPVGFLPILLWLALLLSLASAPENRAQGNNTHENNAQETFSAEDHNNVITDFSDNTEDLQWTIQNDSVMGGKSVGSFTQNTDHLLFTGSTNTDGGGFSSIRSKPLSLDLAMFTGIALDIVGDGRRYTLSLQTDATWRGRRISYWSDFDTVADKQVTVKVPFAGFIPQFRGFRLDGPALDAHRISNISVYIYDQKDGPFSLQLYRLISY